MQELTEAEVAWLAGIYEGEGSCAVTTGRAIRIEICMTDKDVMERIHNLTDIGTLTEAPLRGDYKQTYRWSVGSKDAVAFLETILPWLGVRRSVRAKDAITNWQTNRTKTTKNDSSCIHGHKFDMPGNKRRKDGSCHLCALEASKRYRERKRLIVNPTKEMPCILPKSSPEGSLAL